MRLAENTSDAVTGLRRAGRASRRGARPDRQRVCRERHLARQQRGPAAQGPAGAAGVGRADVEPLGRLGALRARAPLRPARHRGPRVVARPHRARRASTSSSLPSGTTPRLARTALRRLKDWISAGGTLITIAEASRWAAREASACSTRRPSCGAGSRTSTRRRRRTKDDKKDAGAQPIRLSRRPSSPSASGRRRCPARCCASRWTREHWLSAGTDGEIQVMVEGTRIFTPIKLDKGRNVGVYARRTPRRERAGLAGAAAAVCEQGVPDPPAARARATSSRLPRTRTSARSPRRPSCCS